MARSVWSLISRRSRSSMTASALGGDHAALDLLVLDALLAALGRLVGIVRREVLRPVPEPGFEPIEQRRMVRASRSRARATSSRPAS